MRNINKIIVTLLVSFGLTTSAFAGTLDVTGTAKATYNTVSGQSAGTNTLGITNELAFGANGELDNGWTWSYSNELDPENTAAGGAALNDDTSLSLTTGYGTVAVCISECGLSAALDFSQDAYVLISDTGFAEGKTEPGNISTYNNVQFHTPADLLPFGLVVKAAFSPSGSTLNNSGNASNTAASTTAGGSEMIRIEAAPIDGLAINASYMETSSATVQVADEQNANSGAIAAKYAFGNFSVGAGASYVVPRIADAGVVIASAKQYENRNLSLGYAYNDALTFSFTREESKKIPAAGTITTAAGTSYPGELTVDSIQAAYTMGGMTLALARTQYDNVGYLQASDATETLLAVTMAF